MLCLVLAAAAFSADAVAECLLGRSLTEADRN